MIGRAPLPVGQGVEERRRYLEELRRRIEAGTYRVAARDVAAAMLAGSARSGEG